MFLNVTWTDAMSALSALGAAILTALLTLFALLAWRSANGQLKVMRRQIHEERESRQSQLRPHVIQSDIAYDEFKTLDFEFANIGPGPALEIRITYWVIFSAMHEPDRANAVRSLMETPDSHEGTSIAFGALGSNATRRVTAFHMEEGSGLSNVSRVCVNVRSLWRWQDVFGRKFESNCIATAWSAGHWGYPPPPFQTHASSWT